MDMHLLKCFEDRVLRLKIMIVFVVVPTLRLDSYICCDSVNVGILSFLCQCYYWTNLFMELQNITGISPVPAVGSCIASSGALMYSISSIGSSMVSTPVSGPVRLHLVQVAQCRDHQSQLHRCVRLQF